MQRKNFDWNEFREKAIKDEDFVNRARELIQLQHHYSAAIKEIRTKLEILDDEFHSKFQYNPIHHVESRLKSLNSIAEKAYKKGVDNSIEKVKETIKDIAGIRVICNYVDDVYTVMELLLKQTDVTLLCKKDYIKSPKSNGYRSLHLIVSVPVFLTEGVEDIPVEIQIRTIAMDFWASLEHSLKYKAKVGDTKRLAQRLKMCAERITDVDKEMYLIHKEIMDKKD